MRGPTYDHAPLFSGSSCRERLINARGSLKHENALGTTEGLRWGTCRGGASTARNRMVSDVLECGEVRNTHEVVREGRDLLDSADHDVVDALVLALLEQRVVHLTCTLQGKSAYVHTCRAQKQHTRAEDMPADLLRGDDVLRVGVRNVTQEVAVTGHIREVGSRSGMAEEGLREEEDQLGGERVSKVQEMLRYHN